MTNQPLSPSAQAVDDALLMTDLSPGARAVLEAVTWKRYDVPPEGLPAFAEEMAPLIAAALRAAANQVVPPALEEEYIDRNQALPLTKMVQIRRQLFAIAAELEGSNTSSEDR